MRSAGKDMLYRQADSGIHPAFRCSKDCLRMVETIFNAHHTPKRVYQSSTVNAQEPQLNSRVKTVLIAGVALGVGVVLGYFLVPNIYESISEYEEVARLGEGSALPADLMVVLDRFTLVNRATDQTLEKFMMLGGAEGVYEEGGDVFETYVLSFEDRYGGAEADNDFLDVMVEFKRVRGESSVTVRMVQLGLDTIDVYLDGELIGSIRPGIEVQVKT